MIIEGADLNNKEKAMFALRALYSSHGFSLYRMSKFEEFDLDNGLHVILHQDNSAPVVVTSVMYDVGGKDYEPK